MLTLNRRTLFLLLATVAPARAHSVKHGNIAIGHAWALPVANYPDGQVFFPLVNNDKEPDALVAARSERAAVVELRENARYDHPPAEAFILDPGKPVPMRPSARHLRLMGLRKPLATGDRFTIILDFERAGEVEIEVFVEPTSSD
jgi:periplasmic copper chaperone A